MNSTRSRNISLRLPNGTTRTIGEAQERSQTTSHPRKTTTGSLTLPVSSKIPNSHQPPTSTTGQPTLLPITVQVLDRSKPLSVTHLKGSKDIVITGYIAGVLTQAKIDRKLYHLLTRRS